MRKLRQTTPLALFLGLALAALLGCAEGNPVAPEGTTLTITANPSSIPLNGAAEIVIVGRKPDGNPLNVGTEIRLSTSLGSITGVVEADESGVARALLSGDNRAGVAAVTATTGDGMTSVETSVQIGESAETQLTVTLTADPSVIDFGESSRISAIVRRPDGSPVSAGQVVRFFASLGQINSQATTDATGVATTRLDSGDEAGMATVTPFAGSSQAATTMVSISRGGASSITLQARFGETSVDRSTGGMVELVAFVRDQDGALLEGGRVTFSTRASGTSFNPILDVTDGDGKVETTWTIGPQGSTVVRIEATAQIDGAAGGVVSDTFSLTVTGTSEG